MPNILIVDDDAVVRSYLTAVLGRAGYEVLAVSSGKEALRRYQVHSPALVILDIVMPESCGTRSPNDVSDLVCRFFIVIYEQNVGRNRTVRRW